MKSSTGSAGMASLVGWVLMLAFSGLAVATVRYSMREAAEAAHALEAPHQTEATRNNYAASTRHSSYGIWAATLAAAASVLVRVLALRAAGHEKWLTSVAAKAVGETAVLVLLVWLAAQAAPGTFAFIDHWCNDLFART